MDYIRIGEKKLDTCYTKRCGAYAIIEREQDKKIAIVDHGKFFFLGGGLEKDETEEQALKREIIEEAGYGIKNVQFFNKVLAWEVSQSRGPLDITATFYLAKFDQKIALPIEKDYKILWVNPAEYIPKLHYEYQRYILKKYVELRDRK